jgi:aminoglycoside phosphotransferase (APT) family kinase protein
MSSTTPTVDYSAVVRALRGVNSPALELQEPIAESSITYIDGGVNDVFVVSPEQCRDEQFVIKFGTYSEVDHLRAGVAAYRVLAAFTDLLVPTIYAFEPDNDNSGRKFVSSFAERRGEYCENSYVRQYEELPPFVVMEYLPGEILAEDFLDTQNATNPEAVRLLGAVINIFNQIPKHAADGYGFIQQVNFHENQPYAVGEYDDCAAWLVDYASTFYANPPEHEALEAIVPKVPDYLQAHRDRLPTTPSSSVVITDLSPQNLLSPSGEPPSSIGELTGVIDLERAKVGPVEFTAVNTEYLLTRFLSDPEVVRDALYDPLPFEPDMPARDLYRVIAIGRSVAALPFWYEPGSETYQQRGDAIATELDRII